MYLFVAYSYDNTVSYHVIKYHTTYLLYALVSVLFAEQLIGVQTE